MGLESQNFKRVWGLTGNSRGVGGFKPKTFHQRGMDIFCNNTLGTFAAHNFPRHLVCTQGVQFRIKMVPPKGIQKGKVFCC